MLSLKYDFDFVCKKKGFDGAAIKAEGKGGCDALAIVSIIRDGDEVHDGSKSFAMLSIDGFNDGVIPDTEWFQVMCMIANHVKNSPDAPQWQRDLCSGIHETVKTVVMAKRPEAQA